MSSTKGTFMVCAVLTSLSKVASPARIARCCSLLLAACVWGVFGVPSADAGVVIQAETVQAEPGASSGYIEVYCYNNTSEAISLSSFNLIVTTEAPVVLTTASSSQYVPQVYTPVFTTGDYGATLVDPGQVYGYETAPLGSATISSGATVGLIRIPYEILGPTTEGQSFNVTVTGVEVMSSSGEIPLDSISFAPGQIAIVPEPSTVILLANLVLLGGGLALIHRYRSRRRAKEKPEPEPEPFFDD